MDIEILRSGKELNLYALVVNGKCLIRDFINSLENQSKKQVAKLLEQRAAHLVVSNEQKFRSIGDNIFELKTRGGVRILCFWGGPKRLIITHGFFKPTRKILQAEKAKAIRWFKEYQVNCRL